MKIIELMRISSFEDGTFGILKDGEVPFALTLEREWLDNVKNISCIPIGAYLCKRVASPKFGNTFEVKRVPNRTHILFHKGNISEDTHGCIIVGEQFEHLGGATAVLSSKKGFGEFMYRLRDEDEFTLIIID